MSLDINLTNVESTTNKKTTLTDNSDTFYPTQKAVKTAVDLKVDVVAGKGLSANDFTNTLKTKLDGIEAGAEVNVNADWNAVSGDAQILNKPTIPSIAGLATETFVTNITDNKVDKVTGSRLITSAESTVLGNTSGTNTGNETASTIGAIVNGASSATPNDTDLVATVESSVVKKITWTNVKAFLKTYFDTIYQAILTATNLHTFVDSLTGLTTPVDADRMIIVDNSASLAKKITWGNIKATLKTYFDTIYTTTSAVASQITTALSGYVVGNTAITGATKTKITYDSKGLVTSGADATTADIADSSNKRYQTDTQKTNFTNPKITVECIDALTVDFYAMYSFQIDSVTAITNSPTTTILVNNSAYTFGVSIATGAKITVTLNTAGVVNLNTTRL